MMRTRAVLLAFLFTTVVLAGCSQKKPDAPGPEVIVPEAPYTTMERVSLPFNVNGTWSYTLVEGAYGILAGLGVFVSVPLPPEELGAAVLAPEGPQAHLGLFLPDIPGCDWQAASLPEQCKIPVIADVGPYYSTSTSQLPQNEGDTIATSPANRLGRFLIENFVPHGYAVAQVSVMGSGDSNHCFDMFGTAEQLGVNAAVEWLGTQAWSNGNVGLIGRSYDGSTPWQAATFGNPHLKTIVPISGLHGLQALVTRNGTSEGRVYSFHNVVYGQFGLDGDLGDAQHVCPDYLIATPMGVAALTTGDEVVPLDQGYWREREFLPRVLGNYRGSVYFIHGLQDWNVDPALISPAFQQLRDVGLDVKGLFGQWAHMYPDRPTEHVTLNNGTGGEAFPHTVRYDWAEDLKEWFDYYLKDLGQKPILKVEVQDNVGRWRIEETYPPQDVQYLSMAVPGDVVTISPASGATSYELGVVDADSDTMLAGHLYLEASVTPQGANGQIYFEVRDLDGGVVNNNGDKVPWRLAFGTMDLRYRGSENPVAVPQETIQVRVQSQPFDFVVPAGHRLELVVSQSGGGYQVAPSAAPMEFDPATSNVLLPVIDRPADVFFMPPAWNGTAQASAPQP
jgi:predicted acyl esterase